MAPTVCTGNRCKICTNGRYYRCVTPRKNTIGRKSLRRTLSRFGMHSLTNQDSGISTESIQSETTSNSPADMENRDFVKHLLKLREQLSSNKENGMDDQQEFTTSLSPLSLSDDNKSVLNPTSTTQIINLKTEQHIETSDISDNNSMNSNMTESENSKPMQSNKSIETFSNNSIENSSNSNNNNFSNKSFENVSQDSFVAFNFMQQTNVNMLQQNSYSNKLFEKENRTDSYKCYEIKKNSTSNSLKRKSSNANAIMSELKNMDGLLDVAIKTTKLIHDNHMFQIRLLQLKAETSKFMQSLFSKPENQYLMKCFEAIR